MGSCGYGPEWKASFLAQMDRRYGSKPSVEHHTTRGGDTRRLIYRDKHRNRHRGGDKPADIRYFSNGSVEQSEWWVNGQLHRDNNEPAIVSSRMKGMVG